MSLFPVGLQELTDSLEIDIKSVREAYIKADNDYNEEAKRFEKLYDEHARVTEVGWSYLFMDVLL